MIFQQKCVYELMGLHQCCISVNLNAPDKSTLKPKLNDKQSSSIKSKGKGSLCYTTQITRYINATRTVLKASLFSGTLHIRNTA